MSTDSWGTQTVSTAVKTIHGQLKAQWSFQLPHYIEILLANVFCHFAVYSNVHKLSFCSSEVASVLLAATYLPILPMCESAICNVIFLQQSVFAICCCTRHLQQTCCCAACTPHSLVSARTLFLILSSVSVFSSQHHISIQFKLITGIVNMIIREVESKESAL